MIKITAQHEKFIDAAAGLYPGQAEFSKSQIKKICAETQCPNPSWLQKPAYRVGHGTYSLEMAGVAIHNNVIELPVGPTSAGAVNVLMNDVIVIPESVKEYVPFGHFTDLKSILLSRLFFPVFITGLSGNGKTMMVEQVCAKLKRECYRVNVTIETDEDDLIGSNTLIDGNIQFREGPVLKAMRKGAVLLIDEIDLASNKIMCMQSILEGSGYLNKKTGEYVSPAPGFTIIATANTKGKGSDDGRFIGTNVLNEAFLERFSITMEQEYPSNAIERKILTKEFERLEVADQKDYIINLVNWADVIRKSFFEGAIDELISTRRLVHIAQAFTMFKDKMKAIELCVSRFDTETKATFLDLYTKIDAEAIEVPEYGTTAEEEFDGHGTSTKDAEEELQPGDIKIKDFTDPSNEEETF
jgi:MoxR-like ATPase